MADEQDKDAALLKRLYAEDPEIRRMVQRRVKKDNPAAVFPELEVEDRVASVTQTFGEKLEETNAALQRTNVELVRERKRAEWQKKGFDPDAIEQTIERYGLTGSKDMPVEVAAQRILEGEAQTAAGSQMNARDAGRMRMDEAWGKVANKSDDTIRKFAQDEAHKAIDELVAQNRNNGRFAATALNRR